MNIVCQKGICTGCMACINICPRNAIKIIDELSEYNAVINENHCINCGACKTICPNNVQPDYNMPFKWFQGWANDDILRRSGSSGGLATAISVAFIKSGGYVCSCIFEKGGFQFDISFSEKKMKRFCQSKYVKSNPGMIYRKLISLLKSGEKVLFIGLPCQVAAIRKITGNKYINNLFTIDLICHGTPSPAILEKFLEQYGYSLSTIKEISFRHKDISSYNTHNYITVSNKEQDHYIFAFIDSLLNTKGCYQCQYAKLNRVSDLTLGDSLGSDLPIIEKAKGISLVLCQSEKGIQLLQDSNLTLHTVDIKKSIRSNMQLNKPVTPPKNRNRFFKLIRNNITFNTAVELCYPEKYAKEYIKNILKIFFRSSKKNYKIDTHKIKYEISVLQEKDSDFIDEI